MYRKNSEYDLGKANKGYVNGASDYGVAYDPTAPTAAGAAPTKANETTPVNEEPMVRKVGWREMFRFADGRDGFLMFLGAVLAACHGTLYIVSNLVLGGQVDMFIDYQKGKDYIDSKKDLWGKYNLTSEDVMNNKSIITIIGKMEPNRTDINISFVPRPEIDNDYFLKEMVGYTLAYLIMGGIALVAAFGQITFWVIPAERQVRRIRTAFLKAALRQDVSWYDRLGSGELNTRLSDDMTKIVDGMGDKFGTFIQLFSCFVVAFVQGFAIGWKLTLVMLVIVPALIGAALLASLLNANLTNQELKAYAKAGKVAEEVLGSIRTVVAFGGEEREAERYSLNLYDARNKGIRKGLVLGLGMAVAWFILYGSYALGFWFGAKLIVEDGYTPGKLLVVFFSVLTGAVAIGQAGPKMQAISTARGACYAVFGVIDRVPEIDSFSEEGIKPSQVIGNISFRDVWFRYPTRPDVPILNGMSLDVKVGQTVALVGPSGCGKSTSVSLIQRFYNIAKGSISIDGNDICQLNIKWLRRSIGVVSQEPILFGTTIAENIKYGREGVTMAEVEQAAKEANAFNFICKLPERFETMVGERGAQLSGGQKQRIAIARALVRNPKILLLDEATSALDTESEAIVQSALDKASQGRTTIVIAHRLSTVRNADLICGFRDGVIVEKGSHDELMKIQDGIYQQLVTLQTRQAEMDAQAGVVDGKAVDPDSVEEALARSPSFAEESALKDRAKSFTESLKGSLRASMRSLKRVGYALKMQRLEDEELEELSRFQLDSDADMQPAPVSRIASLNSPESGFIALGCLSALVNGAENPVFAVVFSLLLSVFLEKDADQMKLAERGCLIFIVIGAFVAMGQFGMNYFFAQSGERLTMRLRRMAFKAMLRQDIAWFDDHSNNLGALTTRLATESSSVQGATGSRLGLVLQNVSNIGVGLIIAFVIDWRLSLVMFAFIPLIAITGLVETRVLKGSAGTDKKNLERAGKVALEGIENIRTVASLTKEQHFYETYNKMLELPFKNSMRKAYVLGIAFSLSQSILYVAFALAFFYGTYLIRLGLSTFTNVFMVVAVIIFGAMGIGETIAFAPDYTKARVAASKLFSLFDRVPPIDVSQQGGRKPNYFSGEVSFRDVRFRYPTRPEVAVLRGIELNVSTGKTVALVGSSGCGKSTTVSLVERFYEALKGEVYFDDHNVKDLNLTWLRQQVGIVSQEPILFDKSIADNIAYGDNSRTVTMDEVIAAAKSSNIHNFIASLPLGYDTRVGDRGTQLSGGQKQRVAIARALLRNPKVLLLDEATSALDTQSEKERLKAEQRRLEQRRIVEERKRHKSSKKDDITMSTAPQTSTHEIVQEALDKARAGRTCIVIAHRLSTIQDADQICVFHLGKIVEKGHHNELLLKKGLYYNLHQVQNTKKEE